MNTLPDVRPGILSRAVAALKGGIKAAVAAPPVWAALSPLRPAGVAVMTYHRVASQEDPFPHLDIGVFRRHLEFAARRCDIIAPDQLRQRAEQRGGRRAILLTFDDGFRSYHDLAYPLLKEMGVPAVVFLTTGLTDDPKRLLWADHAFLAVFHGNRPSDIALPWRPAERYDLRAPGQSVLFLKAFKAHVKDVPEGEKAAQLEWLFEALGRCPTPSRQMLTWDEVRATMPLTTYAGHSHTHPILSRISDEQLEEEVRLSKERITSETGQSPRLFAYPNGRLTDMDARCPKVLARHGFDTAFTTEPGINGPRTDWYAAHRNPGEASPLDFPWIVSGLRSSAGASNTRDKR